MRTVSQVLMIASLALTLCGLVPCFGWLNWYGVPVSITCAAVGAVGVFSDRDATGAPVDAGVHAAAVYVGLAATVVGIVRCVLGCGGI